MKRKATIKKESVTSARPYQLQLPIRKLVSERKKVRRLLCAMLPMSDDQRQYLEENKLPK